MMAASVNPGELIDEAIPGSSPSFNRPPWTSFQKQRLHRLAAAPTQPDQMTGGEESGLISGDATPSLRRLPLLLPPEKHSNEEEDLDGPDLAKKTPQPTPILHKGSRQNLET
jgi:hypothetical protein